MKKINSLQDYNAEKAIEIWRSGRVPTKTQNYAMYHHELLGNHPLFWNSLEEITQSGYDGHVCIRSKKGISRGKVAYNITQNGATRVVAEWVSAGIDPSTITFNQSLPDEELLVQGEVCRQHWTQPVGYSFHGTFVKKPMNIALSESSFDLNGLAALLLLRNNLWSQSFLDITSLLDQFPKAAIEFSAYGVSIGNLPARNTLIWEVREY